MHAMCLEVLREQLKPGCRALDVGSGSGYLTAAMGVMVWIENEKCNCRPKEGGVRQIGSEVGCCLVTRALSPLLPSFSLPPGVCWQVGGEGKVVGIDHLQELVSLGIGNMEEDAAGSKLLEDGTRHPRVVGRWRVGACLVIRAVTYVANRGGKEGAWV